MRHPLARGVSIRGLMKLVLISGLICALLAWFWNAAIRAAHQSAKQAQCIGHLKVIALGMHNYHSSYGCFPPAYTVDAQGKPMHSWRVLLLPYIEHGDLYNAYNFAEPWNSPNNSKLADRMPQTYSCPNCPNHFVAEGGSRNVKRRFASYFVVGGPGTAFEGCRSSTFADFGDGQRNTILLGHVANANILWMEPRDLDMASTPMTVNGPVAPSLSSMDPSGIEIAFVDGSIRPLPPKLTPAELKALLTINGGEKVTSP